jgi:hypothetical protein
MRPKTPKVTRLDYCQYLLVSQINSTLTNFAEHREKFSHDALNRYLEGEKLSPKLTWENIQNQVVQTGKDSWYATQDIMLTIEKSTTGWTEAEKQHGKTIKIKGFPVTIK